jgi:DNA-binding MarR family transcriptional regulator
MEIGSNKKYDQVDNLVKATFRLSSALLSARDKMVKDIGLTSTLWQALDVIARGMRPLNAAQIARQIGLTRQALQRTMNDLVGSGMVTLAPNPDDRRTQLIAITAKGKAAVDAANERQHVWFANFHDGLSEKTWKSAADFINTVTAVAGALPERPRPVEVK